MGRIFENVKVGDKVTILNSQGYPSKVRAVTKVLKNWFVVDETKYGFLGFEKSSSAWHSGRCVYWKQEHTDYIKLANARFDLKNLFKEELDFLTYEEAKHLAEEIKNTTHYKENLKELLEGL